MGETHKFGWIPDEERSYDGNVFAIEKTSGPDRLVIAPSAHHVSVMIGLLQILIYSYTTGITSYTLMAGYENSKTYY
jgi:hypothetical protein